MAPRGFSNFPPKNCEIARSIMAENKGNFIIVILAISQFLAGISNLNFPLQFLEKSRMTMARNWRNREKGGKCPPSFTVYWNKQSPTTKKIALK
jgi:hypothetical protein